MELKYKALLDWFSYLRQNPFLDALYLWIMVGLEKELFLNEDSIFGGENIG